MGTPLRETAATVSSCVLSHSIVSAGFPKARGWSGLCGNSYFTPRRRSSATLSMPLHAGQFACLRGLQCELQCPLHVPASEQSAQVPFRLMRTHTATNATAMSAKMMISARPMVASFFRSDGAGDSGVLRPLTPWGYCRSCNHDGIADGKDGCEQHLWPCYVTCPRRTRTAPGGAHTRTELTTVINMRCGRSTRGDAPRPPRGETFIPPYAAAAAEAGLGATSSSHAHFGMGRKSWNNMAAMSANATTVQMPNCPSAMRL